MPHMPTGRLGSRFRVRLVPFAQPESPADILKAVEDTLCLVSQRRLLPFPPGGVSIEDERVFCTTQFLLVLRQLANTFESLLPVDRCRAHRPLIPTLSTLKFVPCGVGGGIR